MCTSISVEHYALQFLSQDTLVREEVEVDIENGTEVSRIPLQKDMEPVNVMTYFVAVSVGF